MINGVVALLVGLYLILVVWNDKQSAMIKTISDNVGFLKWAGALLTAAYIYSQVDNKTGELIKALIVIALAAMVLTNGTQMFGEFNKLFGKESKYENGRAVN